MILIEFFVKIFLDYFQRFRFKLRIDRKSFVIKHIAKMDVTNILEIGVFNGNFAERMILAAKKNSKNTTINYVGIDLFEQGITQAIYQSEVSLMPLAIENIKFKLSRIEGSSIELIQGNSKDTLPKLIGLKKFDVIVIDGGHSYATVLSDWKNSIQLLKCNGVIFFDDYTNQRGVDLGRFGINDVVESINRDQFKVSISLNSDLFWKSYGLLILRMVKVLKK